MGVGYGMRVEGVGRRVACRSRFCVTTFCVDADRVSKQQPLMPKARDADKERVEKLFKDDGVTHSLHPRPESQVRRPARVGRVIGWPVDSHQDRLTIRHHRASGQLWAERR